MKVKVNIREHLEGATDHNGNLQVSAQIELADLFDSIPEEEEIDVDLDELLAESRQIAVTWSIEDVQEVRPDLTDKQAWEVLQQAWQEHDAGIGINWDVLTCHAEMLFGDAPDTDEAEEA